MTAYDHLGHDTRTSDLMRAAPQDAVYVWSNWDPTWAQDMSKRIDRHDLFVVSRDELGVHNAARIRHRETKIVVVDPGNFEAAQDDKGPVIERVLARMADNGWVVVRC